jgi:hypothetical protein
MKTVLALVAVSILASGCASIVEGSSQQVSVKTIDKGNDVNDAFCELTNSKGTYFAKTPATVKIDKASAPINVKCTKEGYQVGTAIVESFTKAMVFGNIIFGGPIGAGVDMATGAAFIYPNLITVLMGQNIVLNKEDNAKAFAAEEAAKNGTTTTVPTTPK